MMQGERNEGMSDKHAYGEVGSADYPHHFDLQARFSDLDPNNHINNIAIAEMFSEGRNAFVRHMFAQVDRPEGFYFVVGQAAVRYLADARWPGSFTVGTGVMSFGTKSLRLGQGLFMGGQCKAIAEAVLVARQHRATMALDEAMLSHLAEYRLRPQLVPAQLR